MSLARVCLPPKKLFEVGEVCLSSWPFCVASAQQLLQPQNSTVAPLFGPAGSSRAPLFTPTQNLRPSATGSFPAPMEAIIRRGSPLVGPRARVVRVVLRWPARAPRTARCNNAQFSQDPAPNAQAFVRLRWDQRGGQTWPRPTVRCTERSLGKSNPSVLPSPPLGATVDALRLLPSVREQQARGKKKGRFERHSGDPPANDVTTECASP